jgi:hypothetical protein
VKSDFDRQESAKLLNIAGCLKYKEAVRSAQMNSTCMSSGTYGGCEASMLSIQSVQRRQYRSA